MNHAHISKYIAKLTREMLLVQAKNQPYETRPQGDYTTILRKDRYFNIVMKWMEAYQLFNDANKYQIN